MRQPTCPVARRQNRQKSGADARGDRFTMTVLIVTFQIDGPARPCVCDEPSSDVRIADVGVLLTPIITKETTALDALRGQTLAVDGNGELYQFLALIRLRDGTPLQDSKGRTTSHLSGLFYRTTRLMSEHALKLVFVFDGTPPPRKAQEVAKRRASRQKYEEER